jgi:3-oxoacyl-(acyl-carrier-protein) synthase
MVKKNECMRLKKGFEFNPNLSRGLDNLFLSIVFFLIIKEFKNLPCKIAAQIDRDKLNDSLLQNNILKKSDLKSMSLANVYALAAAEEAIKDSGWTAENTAEQYRAGASIAIGMSGLIEISEAATAFEKDANKGYKHLSPYFVPKILGNLSSGLISIKYKLKVTRKNTLTTLYLKINKIKYLY